MASPSDSGASALFIPQTSRSLNIQFPLSSNKSSVISGESVDSFPPTSGVSTFEPTTIASQIQSQITNQLSNARTDSDGTPRTLSTSRESRSTRLVWQNVTFTPESVRFGWSSFGVRVHRERRSIISGLTGELACGQLKAIIGPSGVGKSTLLKIITGRRTTQVTGNIFVRNAFVRPMSNSSMFATNTGDLGSSLPITNQGRQTTTRTLAQVAYIPQHDYHLRGLTVRESLMFAAKLKLINRPIPLHAFDSDSLIKTDGDPYDQLVRSVLHVLMLNDCADTLVPRCSGGQVRRLSIGVELLGFPQLMLLDEPTTGLDFVSALQTVRLLRSLTEFAYRPGILCTIHQPSAEILSLFTHLYLIGVGGVCIYDGPTDSVEQQFAKFNLICPPYFNLADYLLQCSYGEFGDDLVKQMANQQSLSMPNQLTFIPYGLMTHCPLFQGHSQMNHLKQSPLSGDGSSGNDCPIQRYHRQLVEGSKPFWGHLNILMCRTFRNQMRTSEVIALKVISGIFISIFLGSLHNYHVGEQDYCFNGALFAEMDLSRITFHEFAMKTNFVVENVACTSFLLMFIAFIESIPNCLTFSREVHVIIKEKSNGWYSCLAYYLAKTLVEMPFQFLGPLSTLSIYYPLTGQSSEYWRFGLVLSAFILCALIGKISSL
jgi:ABC-type multidrug transport system ATPase subunit